MSSGEKKSQLSKLRATAIEVSGVEPSLAPSPIAIGKGRIGQLYQGRLRVWQLGNLKAPELELGVGLRGVTALSDGSLAVIGPDSACVLRPQAQVLACDKILGMLLPEGRAHVWGTPDGSLGVLEDTMVSHLHLAGKEAMLDRSLILEKSPLQFAPAGASTVAWADSDSVYTTSSSGVHSKWTPPLASPLHLAPVRDGIWISLSDHRVVLVSGAKVVQTVHMELRVISMSADDKHLAVLTSDDYSRGLHVSLLEPTGKKLWRTDLAPPVPPVFDKDPYVVLSPFEPIIVVGSTATLRIFERATGKLIGEAG